MNATLSSPPVPRALPGSFPRRSRTYPSLLEFVLADPDRAGSDERDVGLGWTSGEHLYRCAVVFGTREVYICQLGPPEQGGGHVRVLGRLPDGAQIDDLFAGWQAAHGRRGSLDWLLARARRLRDSPEIQG